MLNADTSRGPSRSGAIAELREEEDEAYFSSYGHYSIHEEMLKVRLSPSNIYLRPYLLGKEVTLCADSLKKVQWFAVCSIFSLFAIIYFPTLQFSRFIIRMSLFECCNCSKGGSSAERLDRQLSYCSTSWRGPVIGASSNLH